MDRLRRIDIHEDGEVNYFFEDSDEPFVPWEFSEKSPTRRYLMDIQHAIKAEVPSVQEHLFETI
jgi:hypothetical protein